MRSCSCLIALVKRARARRICPATVKKGVDDSSAISRIPVTCSGCIEGSGHAVSGVRGPLRWIGGPATDSVLTELTVLNPLSDGVPAPPGQRVAAWGIRYDRPDAPPAPPVTAEPANVYEAQKRLAR